MHKKPLIFSVVTVFLMSVLFGYSLVFWEAGSYNGPVVLEYNSGKNIYPADLELNKTKLLFRSAVDLSDITITSSCDTYSKMSYNKNDLYYFELKYFSNCKDGSISLINNEGQTIYSSELEIIEEYSLYNSFVDYPSEKIQNTQLFLSKKLLSLSSENLSNNLLLRQKQQREINEVIYLQNFLQDILDQRDEKYLVPVAGYNIATSLSKIPNAGRPYRSDYTDGIHHGWDVGSQLWENVRALADSMVIRVVSEFEFEDLNNLDKSENLTYEDKLENLDILRWNQIWLKTAKWDVVFYSHLQDISTHIKEWMMVRKWETLWTIGISWVPDKNYTDYHLHFPVHKNPYNKDSDTPYTYLEYMKWDWYYKWESLQYVLSNQDELFQKEY